MSRNQGEKNPATPEKLGWQGWSERQNGDRSRRDPDTGGPVNGDKGITIGWLLALVVAMATYQFVELKGDYIEHKKDSYRQSGEMKEAITDVRNHLRTNQRDAERDRALILAIARKLKVDADLVQPSTEETR